MRIVNAVRFSCVAAALLLQQTFGAAIRPRSSLYNSNEAAPCQLPDYHLLDPLPYNASEPLGDYADDEPEELDKDPGPLETTLRRRAPVNAERERTTRIEGGKALWQRLQSVLGSPPVPDFNAKCSNLGSRWEMHKSDRPNQLKFIWPLLLPELLQRPEDPSDWYPITLTPDGEGPNFKSDDNGAFRYDNTYSPKLGTIVAVNTRGRRWDEYTGNYDDVAIDRWSDATLVYWNMLCVVAKEPASNLKYILRDQITNEVTKGEIKYILDQKPNWETLGDWGLVKRRVLTPADGDDFFAVLKTPNVVGVMHMLTDHSNRLGKKTIKSLGIVQSGRALPLMLYYAWIELEEYGSSQLTNGVADGDSNGAGRGTINQD